MPHDSWDDIPKPWKKTTCEDRYVRGSDISLDDLAKIAEVPRSTIGRWCSIHHWKQLRRAFHAQIVNETLSNTQTAFSGLELDLLEESSDTIREKLANPVSSQIQRIKGARDDISQTIAENLQLIRADLAIQHFNSAKLCRTLAELIIKTKIEQLEAAKAINDAEYNIAVDELSESAQTLNYLSQIIERSVRIESESMGFRYYVDIHAAFSKLKREGYEILDPTTSEE